MKTKKGVHSATFSNDISKYDIKHGKNSYEEDSEKYNCNNEDE